MYGYFDKYLRTIAPTKRYSSLAQAGISLSEFTMTPKELENATKLIRFWREKITRKLITKFRAPAFTRSEMGPLVNVEEALDGVPDCYRRILPRRPHPLRIGINVSRAAESKEIVGIRGGAILALINLCKSRGQNTEIEICYGNGMSTRHNFKGNQECHVRINLINPSPQVLTRVCCSSQAISLIGQRCVLPLSPGKTWIGVYRFYEYEAREPRYKKEYDFALDRIDTTDARVEEERVLQQFEKMRLL